MKKSVKILSLGLIGSVTLFLYLILTSEPLKNEKKESNAKVSEKSYSPSEGLKEDILTENYKEKIKEAMKPFFEKKEISSEEVEKIKEELIDISLPEKFKSLHLELISILSDYENYLAGHIDRALIEERLSGVKINNSWIK